MKKVYFIAIPAYNEANNIERCLLSIFKASRFAGRNFVLKRTYICLNGCIDNTKEIVDRFAANYPQLNIKVIFSDKGMNRAIGTAMGYIKKTSLPIVKIDADVEVKENSIYILLKELNEHLELQIVGAHPLAKNYRGKNIYKNILSNILDVRSKYPLSQIAVFDVKDFHQIAKKSPQPKIPQEFELRSRIYFHGRFYALRNKEIWTVPPERIGDDTYLTLDTYKRFRKGSIRIRYDALCYYRPSTSLKSHWKVYKRIFCDTYTLFQLSEFSEMKDFARLEAVRLDWNYICTLSLKVKFYFVVYVLIKTINSCLYKISPKYQDNLWTYKIKE